MVGRPTLFAVAFRLHWTIIRPSECMAHAIETEVVRFWSDPSLKASPLKEAHAVSFEIKGVHAEQVLSERHLFYRHGETGGVHRLLFHGSLHSCACAT